MSGLLACDAQALHLAHHGGGVDAASKRHYRQSRRQLRWRAAPFLVDAQDERGRRGLAQAGELLGQVVGRPEADNLDQRLPLGVDAVAEEEDWLRSLATDLRSQIVISESMARPTHWATGRRKTPPPPLRLPRLARVPDHQLVDERPLARPGPQQRAPPAARARARPSARATTIPTCRVGHVEPFVQHLGGDERPQLARAEAGQRDVALPPPDVAGERHDEVLARDRVGRLVVRDEDQRPHFAALRNVTRIEGVLNVFRSPGFLTLHGLENLEVVQGDVFIHLNPNLVSIAALGKLRTVTGNLVIAGNDRLPQTEVEAVAAHITVGGTKTLMQASAP